MPFFIGAPMKQQDNVLEILRSSDVNEDDLQDMPLGAFEGLLSF